MSGATAPPSFMSKASALAASAGIEQPRAGGGMRLAVGACIVGAVALDWRPSLIEPAWHAKGLRRRVQTELGSRASDPGISGDLY